MAMANDILHRSASIVGRRTQHGLQYHSASTYALTVLLITEILESISLSSAQRILTVRQKTTRFEGAYTDWITEWQWDQLRIMKVGGNESATKFFQSNGGTAALNSKDPKTKYGSNAATKYKEELKRRAAKDALEYVTFEVLERV
jgi:hypothetical protein